MHIRVAIRTGLSASLWSVFACIIMLTSHAPAQRPSPTPDGSSVMLRASFSIGQVSRSEAFWPGRPFLPLIEHKTLLSVPVTAQLNPGLGGARSGPIDAFVCSTDDQGECLKFGVSGNDTVVSGTFYSLTSDAAVSQTLKIAAPTAGAHSRLRLSLCIRSRTEEPRCKELLAVAESNEMAVAAVYRAVLREIQVNVITSPHTDTLYAALEGSVRGKSVDCRVAHSCEFGVGNADHIPNNVYSGLKQRSEPRWVGPFTLVPDTGPDLIVSFGLFNFGAGGYSSATWNRLKTKVMTSLGGAITFAQGSPNHDVIPYLINSANPPYWKGCDGPLLAGVRILANKGADSLAAHTAANGTWSLQETSTPIPARDGCKVPNYTLKWEIERISKP